MKTVIIAALFLLSVGCTSAKISRSLSSGVIGCPANEIKITNERASMSGTHEYNAECRGKKFFCSYVYGSNTNCALALEK